MKITEGWSPRDLLSGKDLAWPWHDKRTLRYQPKGIALHQLTITTNISPSITKEILERAFREVRRRRRVVPGA